jgi:flagellar basal-body rod protein FlgC
MDYYAAFAIGASGLEVQKTRLDVSALNLANAHSTRAGGTLYQPLTVISAPRTAARGDALLSPVAAALPALGAEVVSVQALGLAPRLVHEPGHPDADARGFVAYPAVEPLREMLTLMSATRAYEANLSALNAARTMAQRALEIGGNS